VAGFVVLTGDAALLAAGTAWLYDRLLLLRPRPLRSSRAIAATRR
jgi:hypothetical protein